RAVERISEHVLAVHAEPEARDGDAELRRRNIAILVPRVVEHPLNGKREAIPGGGAVIDRRTRSANDRELRGDEDPVPQDERSDDQERDHARVSSFCGASFRGRLPAITDVTTPPSTASISSGVPSRSISSPGSGRRVRTLRT